MFKIMNEEQVEFLRNRSGDLCHDEASIPEEVDKWTEKEGFGEQEEGYVVNYNGVYGYLYDEEYSHDKQTDDREKQFALENGLKSEEVLSKLHLRATKLSENIDSSIVVMVGNETGFLDRHELCIFFPFKTTNETYKKTLELLNNH